MGKIAPSNSGVVSVSVVSHLQIKLVAQLLCDLDMHCSGSRLELVLTLNMDEDLPFGLDDFSFPIKLIRNQTAKGFGSNHNQAFRQASGRYFCVLNPDIRLENNPFDALVSCFSDSDVGVVAPLVLGPDGTIDDSARRFPTPFSIFFKALGRYKDIDYAIGEMPFHPDWVGGMCLLFLHTVFEQLGGFDERYFLYYEDVDICARLRLLGYDVLLNPQAKVTHHAQRTSRRNLTYLRWHFKSMMRFFLSPVFWRVYCLGRS